MVARGNLTCWSLDIPNRMTLSGGQRVERENLSSVVLFDDVRVKKTGCITALMLQVADNGPLRQAKSLSIRQLKQILQVAPFGLETGSP